MTAALVVRADANRLPLADSTVDLVVTSPPYFGLRSYQDGGEHYAGQVGDEASPQEFVDALLAVTAECVRVLKPAGSIWVNLGDKYVADNRGSGGDRQRGEAKHAPRGAAGFVGRETARQKSLMGLPWRYALGCIDRLGLILRAEVIWSKPNGLPESVTDRVRRSHEQWFHFTKEPRYFSAVDEVREPHESGLHGAQRGARTDRRADEAVRFVTGTTRGLPAQPGDLTAFHPLGKLPGSVWTIPTQPLSIPTHLGVNHFAAFPMEWPRRIIRGWSPAGICNVCDEGIRPVSERIGGTINADAGRSAVARLGGTMSGGTERSTLGGGNASRTITGGACGCGQWLSPNGGLSFTEGDTRPSVVLDPFGGTGTTALVAACEGRIGISVDLSHDYSRLAHWRTTDPGERARAMQVEKPPVQVDGQEDLFGAAS